MTVKAKKITAWTPAKWDIADAAAIQALLRGDASPDMQKRALNWIIESAASTYDAHYWPDSSRDTDYALGRASVGQQIVKLCKLNLAAFKGK